MRFFLMFLFGVLFLKGIPLSASEWSYSAVTVEDAFEEGDGTSLCPYQISNAQHLANLAYLINKGMLNQPCYFVLSNDIVLNEETSSLKKWISIGDGNAFKSIIDGQGYTISGLYTQDGLFGIVEDAIIDNIGIIDAYNDVYLKASTSLQTSISSNSGLLVRESTNSAIKRCFITGNIEAQMSASAVNKRNKKFVLNCGAICGVARNTQIQGCYAVSNINLHGSTDKLYGDESVVYAGGIAGYNDNSNAYACYHIGTITTNYKGKWKSTSLYNNTFKDNDCYYYSEICDETRNGHLLTLLNNNVKGIIYYQSIGVEDYPTLKKKFCPISIVDGSLIEFGEETCDIFYSRDFYNDKWQPLYVPFSISIEALAEKGIQVAKLNDTHMYDRDDDGVFEEVTVEFLRMTSGSTKANYPYLIRANEACNLELTLQDVTLAAAAETSISCSTIDQVFTFTGTYTGVDGQTLYDNHYYVMSGGALTKVSASAQLKPQRWYMKIENKDGSPIDYGSAQYAGAIRVMVDGEYGLSLTLTQREETDSAPIFDLQGRKMEGATRLPAGIYVQSGKKIVIR